MRPSAGLPHDLIRRINPTNPDGNAWALFERGEIDDARFDTLFPEEFTALGHRSPAATCCRCPATCGPAWSTP